jgi:hypothetical protein
MSQLKQAIDDAGGVLSVAAACGISPRAVYQMGGFWLPSSHRVHRRVVTGTPADRGVLPGEGQVH